MPSLAAPIEEQHATRQLSTCLSLFFFLAGPPCPLFLYFNLSLFANLFPSQKLAEQGHEERASRGWDGEPSSRWGGSWLRSRAGTATDWQGTRIIGAELDRSRDRRGWLRHGGEPGPEMSVTAMSETVMPETAMPVAGAEMAMSVADAEPPRW